MPALFTFLKTLFIWLISNFLGRVLVGAGLAIAGSFTFGQFTDYFISKAISSINAIPMTGLIGVAGIDKAISILITGIVIRVYLATAMQSIRIVSKK